MSEPVKSTLRTVRTPAFRLSFPVLPPMQAKRDERNGRETFSVSMLFPPGTDMTPFKAALKAAMVEKFGEDTTKWPKIKRKPVDVILDFATFNGDSNKPLSGDWKGWTKINSSTVAAYPPSCVHEQRDPADASRFVRCTDPREIFGGRWARALVEAYHYTNDGGGVTFGLKNVQLLRRDTPFGVVAPRPEDSFGDDVPEQYRDDGDAFEKGSSPSIVPAQSFGANVRQAADSNGW